MEDSEAGASGILRRWNEGDPNAFDQLVPIVYRELRKLAHYHLRRERDGHSLQTTALVHEAYLRLFGKTGAPWGDRAHFFAVASRVMRRILVDSARKRDAEKRGLGAVHIPLDAALTIPEQADCDLVSLDGALDELAKFDRRKCTVVEMRFFAGLEAKEIANMLQTSEATVRRDWMIAKAWLFRYLERG